MTSLRLLFTCLILLVCGCSPEAIKCAIHRPDKVKRASVNHKKVYQWQRQEQVTARAKEKEYDELMRSQQRHVKTVSREEWDCPKPESAHARRLEKQRKKLDAQNARNLKKKGNETAMR
jgi:hypothetical protein